MNNAYRAATFPTGLTKPQCTFSLTSIGGVQVPSLPGNDSAVRVLILLYRVDINQHLRNVGRSMNPSARPVPLSVDLHYLLTFWAESAENEQLALAWAMRQLHEVPVLDSSILSREAGWAGEDVIHLIPDEISVQDMMRIWDSLEPEYRLSISYIARVVRIEPDEVREEREVVATRFNFVGPASS